MSENIQALVDNMGKLPEEVQQALSQRFADQLEGAATTLEIMQGKEEKSA